jgi:cytochrome P450
METPRDPIAAVTHPEPYPYYADLVARTPFYRDDALGLWVAASAEAVTAVLTSAACLVRPPHEPIPRQLLGTPVADLFRHLVRMNDGVGHCPLKRAVTATLDAVAPARVRARSVAWARTLVDSSGATTASGHLDAFVFRLSAYVVADLLGLPGEQLPAVAAWVGDFAACLAPGSTAAQVARGADAAAALSATFRALLSDGKHGRTDGLLAGFAREAGCAGDAGADVIIANGIGLLSQAYEATAGLIGNTLVALATHQAVREQALAAPHTLPAIVREVLCHDPPVQNTRRFLARDERIMGQSLRAGDAILVVLAAANRDPAANARPERFEPFRADRQVFTFGAGGHACPGDDFAVTIAAAGVAQLLASDLAPARSGITVAYRASGNVRIPVFAASPCARRAQPSPSM